MSKLPNAPLLEVIFEIRWDIVKSGIEKYQFLHGDLYALLKAEYPERELLAPSAIPIELLSNKPVHRFRKTRNGYPLMQLGPGLITVNTDDNFYDWDKDFFSRCQSITESFFNVYPATSNEKFRPSLIYIDFLKVDVSKENVLTYINNNLSINISQDFFSTEDYPEKLDFGIGFPTPVGHLTLTLNVGRNNDGLMGLVMQTNLHGPEFDCNKSELIEWLEKAHNFSTQLFKEITKGKLYETFK